MPRIGYVAPAGQAGDTIEAYRGVAAGAMLADAYRIVIGEAIRATFARRRRQGLRASAHAPYGARFDEAGRVVPCETELATIARMRELYAGGELSLRQVAERLTREGHLNRAGKPWATQAVFDLIRRPAIQFVKRDRTALEQLGDEGVSIGLRD
jgi:recombinase